MANAMNRGPRNDPTEGPHLDGTDRRGFLKCMAWAGTGLVWAVSGGVLSSCTLAQPAAGQAPSPTAGTAPPPTASFYFVQISDSHIGFAQDPNRDPTATLQEAIARINALTPAPAFVLHTGDLSHGQKAGSFDTVSQLLTGAGTDGVFYVPGEHDVFIDGGQEFLNRFGQGTIGGGWRSFDYQGVHFVGLVNVLNFKEGGAGLLGPDQLDWLRKDLEGLTSSTPVVVYTHIPLWAVYPDWGWVTEDGEQALSYLQRFGSVTVLNGHIHQVQQKVEGNITFHTAMSTAYPQPAPGTAAAPGPLVVPADQLRQVIGVRTVTYVQGQQPLALVDSPLG
jgi:Icc protein